MHMRHNWSKAYSSFFFATSTGFANQSVYITFRIQPATSSLAILSPIIFLFSSEKRRIDCLTGLASGRT